MAGLTNILLLLLHVDIRGPVSYVLHPSITKAYGNAKNKMKTLHSVFKKEPPSLILRLHWTMVLC